MTPDPTIDLNGLSLSDLYTELSRGGLIRRLLELAREEDLGPSATHGDITSVVCPFPRERITANLVAREPCTIAGLQTIPLLLEVFAPSCKAAIKSADARAAKKGEVLATITGPSPQVLRLERTLLNLLSRLSGVATNTAAYIAAMRAGAPRSKSQLLDTRKTTPGLRLLEKYAVRCGGALCHRIGLHDAVLIKDNHLAHVSPREVAAFVAAAASHARSLRPLRFVEVEVDSLDQFERILTIDDGLIDFVLLDNMSPDQLAKGVALRDKRRSRILLEASGGITQGTIAAVAATNVDRISVGSLTRGARSVDLALDVT